MSPESRTGRSIPRLMPSENASSTWLNFRHGPRMRMPGIIRCRGPTTATVSFEAKSVADVLKLARAKPKGLAYASSGNGSAQHLAGALFEQLAKVELTHVPYRGGGPALNDVIGGQVPVVLQDDIYALPSLAGSVLVVLLWQLDAFTPVAGVLVAAAVFAVRLLARRRRWHLRRTSSQPPAWPERPPRTG